jgi:hypothetical protein
LISAAFGIGASRPAVRLFVGGWHHVADGVSVFGRFALDLIDDQNLHETLPLFHLYADLLLHRVG